MIVDLRALGFTYVSFDLMRGVTITAWHTTTRRTIYGRGETQEAALDELIRQTKKSPFDLGDLLG
jgi:hypothetical protein